MISVGYVFFFSNFFKNSVYFFYVTNATRSFSVVVKWYHLHFAALVKFLDGKKQLSIRQYLMAVKMAIFLIIYDNRTK